MPPTTNGADDDDEDERGRAPTPPLPTASKLRGGWTEGQKQNESTSSYAKSFRPEEKTASHQVPAGRPVRQLPPSLGRRRQRPAGRRRLGPTSARCPSMTRARSARSGDKAQAVNSFNIALIGDDGQVLLRSWDVGVRVFNVFKGYSNDPKIAPLTRNFFLVSKTGTKTSHAVQRHPGAGHLAGGGLRHPGARPGRVRSAGVVRPGHHPGRADPQAA